MKCSNGMIQYYEVFKIRWVLSIQEPPSVFLLQASVSPSMMALLTRYLLIWENSLTKRKDSLWIRQKVYLNDFKQVKIPCLSPCHSWQPPPAPRPSKRISGSEWINRQCIQKYKNIRKPHHSVITINYSSTSCVFFSL